MHILRVCSALNWTINTIHTPISSTNILSRPTGPKELFTILAMEQAAITGTKNGVLCKRHSHYCVFVLLPHNCMAQHSNIPVSHLSDPGFKCHHYDQPSKLRCFNAFLRASKYQCHASSNTTFSATHAFHFIILPIT
jgi:hypothetical protein